MDNERAPRNDYASDWESNRKENESPVTPAKAESWRLNILHVALFVFSLAALLVSASYSIHLRYSVYSGESENIIFDLWKGEVVQIADGSVHIIRLHHRESKSLTGGALWGDFDDIPINSEVMYANGTVYYRFAINAYDDDIELAVRNSVSITFDIGTDRGVSIYSVRENFRNVTHIVDSIDGDGEPIGVVFDGVFTLDAGAWEASSRVSTRFEK